MTELTGGENHLPSMMRFVRDQIRENMADVERKIPPDIRPRGRNPPLMITAEEQQSGYGFAAAIHCCHQLPALHILTIDPRRRDDSMRLAQSLDPGASGVVDVRSESAKCPP